MNRLTTWLCQHLMGGHLPSPVAIPTDRSSTQVVSECLRCGLPLVHWFPSPKGLPESPLGVLVWEYAPPPTLAQFAALRLEWDRALGVRTSPYLVAPDNESASAAQRRVTR